MEMFARTFRRSAAGRGNFAERCASGGGTDPALSALRRYARGSGLSTSSTRSSENLLEDTAGSCFVRGVGASHPACRPWRRGGPTCCPRPRGLPSPMCWSTDRPVIAQQQIYSCRELSGEMRTLTVTSRCPCTAAPPGV